MPKSHRQSDKPLIGLILLAIITFVATIILIQTNVIAVNIGVGMQLFVLLILFWYLYGSMLVHLKRDRYHPDSSKLWLSEPTGRRLNPFNKTGFWLITWVTIGSTVLFLLIFWTLTV